MLGKAVSTSAVINSAASASNLFRSTQPTTTIVPLLAPLVTSTSCNNIAFGASASLANAVFLAFKSPLTGVPAFNIFLPSTSTAPVAAITAPKVTL